jgi:RNA polymerase sigma-70 factor (ECF subfamily)
MGEARALAVEPRFAALVTEHGAHLRAVALRLSGNAADASDLVQDALERAMRAFHTLEPGTNARAWLVTILHNLFIDRCRRRTREPRAVPVDDVAVAAPPAPSDDPEPPWASLGPEDLRRALAELDPDFRVVYTMHALEHRSYVEIAETLGINKATVGTRLLRAREKLRRLLTKAQRGAS